MGTKFKRIIMVFLCFFFIFILVGCIPKSDLIPKSIFLDSDNVLNVTFKNEGEGKVPANKGNLAIYIDGRSVGGYSFSNLADQSFRQPDGSLTIRTNFRSGGSNRRIAVFVDSQNEISESNEFQNTLSRTITPPDKNEPDFIVNDLSLGPGNSLRIVVKNIGSAASPDALQVRIRVIVNETVVADLTPSLPSLTADGGMTMITPSPSITVSPNSKVRVLLNTNQLFDELDNTNNIRQEILPDGPSLAPYAALLSTPKLRRNIVWQGAGGTPPYLIKDYASWTFDQKAGLNNRILSLEKGGPQIPSAPPSLLNGGYFSADDAWQIFLAHVAQSLWIEVHNAVPWHLVDFTDEQLAYLLDSRRLLSYSGPANNRYKFVSMLMGNITSWNPRISCEFLSNMKIIKPTQSATIYALTNWMRGHLIHIFVSEDYNVQFGYPGPPPADKVLYPLEGKLHKTAGCWGTTGLYAAVLRSVNIPVQSANIIFHTGSPHSRPVFPSIDRSIPHGDDPYTATLSPSGAVIPSSDLFYTLAEIDAKFLNPSLDCVGSECNSVGEQATYNKAKDHWQLAFDYMADYILYQYSKYGAAYLNDSLRGIRYGYGSSVVEFAKPLFTTTERAAMVTAVENKVRQIGGGNLEQGRAKVIERRERFLSNK